MNTNDIINNVREWLKDTDIEIDLISTEGTDNELISLELYGAPVKELAEYYGTDGRLILKWILPNFKDNACTIKDFQTGEKFSSGYVYRRPEFDRDEREKDKNITPLRLCPDLDKGEIYPAWYSDIKLRWKRFARNVKRNEKKKKCTLNNFVCLESGLNAFYTSSSARQAARFTKDDENENPLLRLENSRQILIEWPSETLGRLRIPHPSHKNKLCPFETPESKLTGLQLNLAADAEPTKGKITAGDELLSIAVGLIPYPNHTDGPRLMMGGKNMKQAEISIIGAEAPIVPGYYEGVKSREIKSLRPHLKNLRFFPYLGLNALTVIMPYNGYTYEDGLVISESLAERLCIKEDIYRRSKTFEIILKDSDLADFDIDLESGNDITSKIFENLEGRYIYGDKLPKPRIKFYSSDDPEQEKIWTERYEHHAPGNLKFIKIDYILKKESGSVRKGTKFYEVELNIKWDFLVERPMGLGDKLTGRNGNKGVVTKIIPDEKMPQIHFKDETKPAELIISPCSIIGRKNLGQIWEMTHSLLIKKGGEKLKNLIEADDLDIENICIDDVQEIKDRLSEFLQETGCNEFGMFNVTCDGKIFQAFAGWQYFCRLHHHAWKKLQARGVKAPYDSATGQPSRCGTLTGQRMGEMENWSLLSHGAIDILMEMRRTQTGNFVKTRELFKKILRSLGIVISEDISGLNINARNHDDDTIERKDLFIALKSDKEQAAFCGTIKDTTCKAEAERIISELTDKKLAEKLDKLIKSEIFFNEDGSIHIEPDILKYSADMSQGIQEAGTSLINKQPLLKELLLKFYIDRSDFNKAQALLAYRDGLINLLSHKTGLPRYYLSGRRYNHSGRAVIVPEPSLRVDNVYLPAAMLIELLDDYEKIYNNLLPDELKDLSFTRKIFNDYYTHKDESKKFAKIFDNFLLSDEGELWCFMIRQPSLHRHSIQAFRVRCWEFPVIGLPPFVTPGFNADFDGDTMAVFIPPYEYAKNLSKFSILNNPGVVGNGKSAFADSLDLALGYWNMNHSKLCDYMSELLKMNPSEKLADLLQDLQIKISESSTGAATLTPLEFNKSIECTNINELIDSGAKGSREDFAKITDKIGNITDKMKDEDNLSDSENMETVTINGNFWDGLTNEELFIYSYSSRYSMAQKKLSVSEAGYLSRQLAEKLYEYTVNIDDCGTNEGLEISYSHEEERLLINGEILPTLGIKKDLERVLWGRVIAGQNHCINSNELESIFDSLKNGGKIIVRSPFYCHEREKGHVCSLCYGADVAARPYDKPEPVYKNFAAGLTAAQAIGERGTQLAMKRFHNVGINSTSPIQAIRKLLVSSDKTLIAQILAEILTVEAHKANKELPQSLIHFEIAAAYKNNEAFNENYLSKIAGEKISRLFVRKPDEVFNFHDSLTTLKSRLLWEGGAN